MDVLRDGGTAHVLTLLEESIDELVGRIVVRVDSFYGDDHAVPATEMAANSSALVQAALRAINAGRPPSDDELAVAVAVGARRARQGVSLENVLRGVRAGAREALTMVAQVATQTGLDSRATIVLTTALWDWVDEMSVAMAEAHRGVELARVRSHEQQRSALVRGLVHGTFDAHTATARAAASGLDAGVEHIVVCVRPTVDHGAPELERVLLPRAFSAGVIAEVDGELVAVLPAEPGGALPLPAGVGAPAPLTGLSRSYREASRARAVAERFGLTGAQRLGDVALLAAVAADEQLGALLVERYVEPVRALGPFGDDLLLTLRTFCEHRQNVESAAVALHVHPNTLRHRLARYEETTGASLRDVRELAEMWWALTYVSSC
jgi:sugar diacid utilization regulator